MTALASATPVLQRRLPFGVRILIGSVVGILLYFALLTVFQYLTNAGSPDPLTRQNALSQALSTSAQQVGNALVLGAIYALVALGYTMVYGIIELINFAHGDVFMVGTFIGFFFLTSFPAPLDAIGLHLADAPITAVLNLAAILIATLVVCMVAMGAINVGIERFAYRPLRHAPRVAPLITAIGVSLILQNIMQVIVGAGDRKVPQLVPNDRVSILGADIRLVSLMIFVVAILLMIALQVFVSRTRLGRAMRATAQDQQAAQLMGVDLNQTIAMTFLIGGALAGAAGVFQGQYFGFVRFDLGFTAGLKAFTAAVLGGIGNLTGAAIGGFLIAFIEVFAQAVGQARWSQAIVFAVLIIVLVFRPAGILGQQIGERA